MKIILRIFSILLVASIVAMAFSMAAGNPSAGLAASDRPAVTNTNGQSMRPMDRPEGGREAGSLTGGLSEVLVTVVKLAGITMLVLLIQGAFSLLEKRRSISIPH